MVCQPRLLEEEDDDEIDLALFTQLKDSLVCPVCFDILKDPLNVKMCLHKFCCNCIESYNRMM